MILRFRTFVFVLLGLLYVASWPGSALRAVAVDLVAPQVPEEIKERDGVLDVVVHAAEGDRPGIAGARVRAFAILDGVAHNAGEAETDREGRANLRDLPQAEHWVLAEAPGRARASQMVVVVAGARRLDLDLGVEHELEVLVKDEQGAPMTGAELEVRGADPFPVGARTGEGGIAKVGRLGEGPFTVVARAPGFEEITRRRVPEGERLTIVLGKQGALMVEVVAGGDPAAPVANARVLLASPGLSGIRSAETDKEGRVRIAGLDPGTYALRAQKDGRVSPIEVGVPVGKGEDKTLRLVLGPGVLVTAKVVDGANDEELKDAKVTLTEGGLSPFPLEGVTDKHGMVTLGPIAPGPASLSARADGFVPKPAVALEEVPGGPVRIALARGAILVGRITDGRGYAVDGATIRIVGTDHDGMPIDEDPGRWSFREAHFAASLPGPSPLVSAGELGVMPGPVPAIPHGPAIALGSSPAASFVAGASSAARAEPWVSGRDGTFRATPITPGRVRAIVHHPQYVEAMSEIVLAESSKEARVDVVLQRGGTLEGRVVDGRRRAVGGAHVTALALRGSFEHLTRTGTDGSFAFAALPDAIAILVARDEDPQTVLARVELTVPDGGKKTVEIVLPEPRPPLPVKVVDPRGNGLDAAQVSAVSVEAGQSLRATIFTDPRGRGEIPSGLGLALRVEVHATGRAARVVTTTAETKELVVDLLPAESVTGEVTSRRREPLAGVEVTLQTDSAVRRTRTNKDGGFTIGDVSPGPARLRVRVPGRAPDERAIVIEDRGGRRPTEVPRFELPEEGIVEGVVVDGRGDPVPGARVARDAVPTYLPASGTPPGIAVTDGRGRFKLGELGEGLVALEAYAADVGRTRRTDIRVSAGRTTDGIKLVITRGDPGAKEPIATGGVAVTLGETVAGLEGPEVVIVAVSEGSEAERGGLSTNDIVLEVGGTKVASIVDARARLAGPIHDDVLVKVRRGERILALRVAREAVRR